MFGILLCLIAMFVLQVVTPYWWWIMVVPAIYALVAGRSGWQGFSTGMASAGLLWLGAGLFYLLTSSDIVAGRIAEMLRLGSGWAVLILTAVLAALAGGFAGSSGYLLKAAFKGKAH
ncbi:MAG: hypothetical protein ACE5I1_23530 [bacterium]